MDAVKRDSVRTAAAAVAYLRAGLVGIFGGRKRCAEREGKMREYLCSENGKVDQQRDLDHRRRVSIACMWAR
jgi:hypothetical protein